MTGIGVGISPIFSGGGFSPFAVGQPIVLLDAAIGITLNGADVSDWADQSGEDNDVSQATAVDQPLYNASDSNWNDNPSVNFDGVSEYIASAPFSSDQAQPLEFFFPFKLNDLAGAQYLFDGEAGARVVYRSDATQGVMWAGTGQNIHTNDTNPHVLSLFFNGASSNSWLDGIQTTPAASPGILGYGKLLLGGDVTPANFANFSTPYFLAYQGTLSNIERNYIGNGLAARFGTTWTDI